MTLAVQTKTSKKFKPVDELAEAKERRKDRQAYYTPEPLVHTMIDTASNVYPSARVLEPSAGDGRIIHYMQERGLTVDACEMDAERYADCAGMGATMVGRDFLEYQPGEVYDLMVMNPPFNKKQDRKHVEHAYSLLRPGGEIVAIMASSSAEAFRDCSLNLPGCEHAVYEKLAAEAFKTKSFNGIPTILATIRKPHPNAHRECSGYSNHATFNAAVSLASDFASCEKAKALPPTPDAYRTEFSAYLADAGCSCYGVNWVEVVEELGGEKVGGVR